MIKRAGERLAAEIGQAARELGITTCSMANCVQVVVMTDGTRILRSTRRDGVVRIDGDEWAAFVADVKAGRIA